ncbi:MAG: phosphatidic acid phosphatase [Clostridiaceae bacterium]|nr:phosphatidic acid phosphatase [Clostridiaceae bacterium]
MKEKFEQYKHFSILSYYIVIAILYHTYEKITIPKYFMYSRLDDYIPFVKEMVIPYLFWYIYIIIALVYLGLTSKKDFYNLCAFMFIGMTICFIIYALFPNGQKLRPVIHGTDFFSRLVAYIYMVDTPTNSAPSMHTLDAIAVHVAFMKCDALKKKYGILTLSFITMVLIILSTVMLKQHSVLDLIYGVALSLVLYLIIYKFNLLDHFITERSYHKIS